MRCATRYNHPRTSIDLVTHPCSQIRALLLALLTGAVAGAQAPLPKIPPLPRIPEIPRIQDPLKMQKPKPQSQPVVRRAEPTSNANVIVLDPAHGGADDGGKLGGDVLEKDVTMAFANRLNIILAAKGFTVVMTHPLATDEMTSDQRVELANRSHAVACVLLHASAGGHGVHLFTSALTTPGPRSGDPVDAHTIVPWDTAQGTFLAQSVRLSGDLATSLNGIGVPLVIGQVSVHPIDSLACPAVAVEMAPFAGSTTENGNYQQQVAEALANALTTWRGRVEGAAAASSAKAATKPSAETKPATPAKPKPRTKPIVPPEEVPSTLEPGQAAPPASVAKPKVPIVRRPPQADAGAPR